MVEQLLRCGKERLSVLLRNIVIKDINQKETQRSVKFREKVAFKPIARLRSYYISVANGIEKRDNKVAIGIGRKKKLLKPILETVQSGQWMNLHRGTFVVETGKPRDNERYPKWLTCKKSGGWLAVIGVNGIVIIEQAVAVSRDPVYIIRRNGALVALEHGLQGIVFGPGGHLILRAFGALVIIPGKGWIEESELIYTCIRPEFLKVESREPALLQPILCVYAGQQQDFYIVQVRQRLIVVNSNSWEVLLRECFWQLEFQTLMRFYRILSQQGIDYDEQNETYLYPNDIIVPSKKLQELGNTVEDLLIVQKGKLKRTTLNVVLKTGHILLLGNCEHLPSSIVIEEGEDSKLTFQREGVTHAIAVTTNAIKLNKQSSQYIHMLTKKKISLGVNGSVCHICLIFTNGFMFLVGSEEY